MKAKWFVQVKGDDDLFHTDSEHTHMSTAYRAYVALEGVTAQLLRGSHVVLRTDQPEHQPTHESLF